MGFRSVAFVVAVVAAAAEDPTTGGGSPEAIDAVDGRWGLGGE